MGSSIGNFERVQCATFLQSIASSLQPCDMVLIGVDSCLDKDKVYRAYNDKDGITHAFYHNGLDHANRLLGYELFKQEDWETVGEFDAEEARHQAFVFPNKDINAYGFAFKAGERIRLENSHKFPPQLRQRSILWDSSGLALRASYVDSVRHGQYCEPTSSLRPRCPLFWRSLPV